jgi:hypothetical protein
MPRNKPINLNNMLFEQLERISDPSLEGEALEGELRRSKAVTGLASQVIANNNTMLAAMRLQRSAKEEGTVLSLPEALTREGDGDGEAG